MKPGVSLPFPMEEYEARLAAIRRAMDGAGLDALLVTAPENIFYISGFDSVGYYQYQALIVPRAPAADLTFLTHAVEVSLSAATSWVEDVRLWYHGGDPIGDTVRILLEKGLANGTIGVEQDTWFLKVSSFLGLKDALPQARLVNASSIVAEMRLVKSPREIEYVKAAARITDAAMEAAIKAVREGVGEHEIAAETYRAQFAAGSLYPALPLIIGSGRGSSFLHGTWSPTKRVQRGELVTLELAGCVHRYQTNILRTVSVGPAGEKEKDAHKVLVEAVQASTEAAAPGVPVAEVDRASRRMTAKYDRYRLHRTGYGLEPGYPPAWMGVLSISESDPHILAPGMVFSIEPTLAFHDQGWGAILGNCVLITETGRETLHRTPLDLVER